MKRILILVCTLGIVLAGTAAPQGGEIKRALNRARRALKSAGVSVDRAVGQAVAEVRRTADVSASDIARALSEIDIAVDAVAETAAVPGTEIRTDARPTVDISGCATDRELAGVRTELETAAASVAEVRSEVREAFDAAAFVQSRDDFGAATRAEVMRELNLSSAQRKKFEPIYKAYREALAKAVDVSSTDVSASGDAVRRDVLKAKLANIAAAAQVKRDYVDKFAAVLTAEQIRQLYNTEGQIGTGIKRAAPGRRAGIDRLRGSGRTVTQDWGAAGDYTALSAASFFDVTVSPSAMTVSVTADDNVIDHISMERDGGKLAFRLVAGNAENIHVKVVVPASVSLCEIAAGSYGKVVCKMPLKGPWATVRVSSYGAVVADIETTGKASVNVSSYGSFTGGIRCGDCNAAVSSYGSMNAPVDCRNRLDMTLGSYAKYFGEVRASDLSLSVSSGAGAGGSLAADALTLSVSSYGNYSGSMECRRARLSVLTGGTLGGVFTGDEFEATVGSYGKISLKGAAPVKRGVVKIHSGASFSAPDLRVADYDLRAAGYARAEVWCGETLRIAASSVSRVAYAGPCRVDAVAGSIYRRD